MVARGSRGNTPTVFVLVFPPRAKLKIAKITRQKPEDALLARGMREERRSGITTGGTKIGLSIFGF